MSRRRSLVDGAQWRAARRYLNGHRHRLTRVAAARYPHLPRVGSSALLCRTSWIPPYPVELGSVSLAWRAEPPRPAVTGTGAVTGAQALGGPEQAVALPLPRSGDGEPYRSYAAALAELDPPGLFANRVSYRLVDLDLRRDRPHLTCCRGTYFDCVNVGEAVAHELAAADAAAAEGVSPRLDLPLRSAVGDPTDLARRPVVPAISVLTLRRDARTGAATFVLHSRDPARVAHAGGLSHVMPVGVFQPSADGDAALTADFSLWRCIVREYSEEFLGGSEDYGDGVRPYDYAAWPFYRRLTGALRERLVRVYYLGMGVDPLSLATDILVVCVIDTEVFDDVFRNLVTDNAEGAVLRGADARGFDFDERTVRELVEQAAMQPAGAAVLRLSWRYRARILAP